MKTVTAICCDRDYRVVKLPHDAIPPSSMSLITGADACFGLGQYWNTYLSTTRWFLSRATLINCTLDFSLPWSRTALSSSVSDVLGNWEFFMAVDFDDSTYGRPDPCLVGDPQS